MLIHGKIPLKNPETHGFDIGIDIGIDIRTHLGGDWTIRGMGLLPNNNSSQMKL